MRPKMVKIGLYVPLDMVERVKKIAEDIGESESVVWREILRLGFSKYKEK